MTRLIIIIKVKKNIVTKGGDRTNPATPLSHSYEQINRVYQSFNIYGNTAGWQRDYVYYGIASDNMSGPFDNNYQECIVGLEMIDDPMSCYNKIADQTGDPKMVGGRSGVTNSGWSEGNFEIRVKVAYGSNTAAGDDLVKYFSLRPSDIFSLYRTKDGVSFRTDDVALKRADLYVPLFGWNLANFSTTIKIVIEETDLNEVSHSSVSRTMEFALNFGLDISWGVVKKGAKFGIEGKTTRTVTNETTTTRGNDELGEAIVNFEDKILLDLDTIVGTSRDGTKYTKYDPTFNTRYETGICRIYLAPLKNN